MDTRVMLEADYLIFNKVVEIENMKKIIFILSVLVTSLLYADFVMFEDNFTKPWTAIGKKCTVSAKGNIMKVSGDGWASSRRLRIFSAGGSSLAGTKLRMSVEARGSGKARIGVVDYTPKHRYYWGKDVQLGSEFKKIVFETTLTREVGLGGGVAAIRIKGDGEFRNMQLVNIIDTSYKISAEPAYQYCSGDAEKVKFTLLKDGTPADSSRLVIKGNEAYDPVSGAAVKAWVENGDPARFDAAAKKIKLDKKLNILYLGDSLTHFNFGHNHADRVKYFLNKYNPGKVELFNYAIRGDEVATLVKRLQGNAKGEFKHRFHDFYKNKYDVAFIFLGQNDTKTSSRNNYKFPVIKPARQKIAQSDLMKILRKHGVKRIIFISSVSANEEICGKYAAQAKAAGRSHSYFGIPAFMEEYNRVTQELCKNNGMEYIDIYTEMKARPDKASLLLGDGVHLSDKGHDFVALRTLEYLAAHQK